MPTLQTIADDMLKLCAGWEYPTAPKSSGSMCIVFNATSNEEGSGGYQIKAVIDSTKAKNIKKQDGTLYSVLAACKTDVALVQPVYIAVSGISRPSIYTLENYLMPTPLFHTIAATCLTNVYGRLRSETRPSNAKQILLKRISEIQTSTDRHESIADMATTKALKIMLGDLMYSESLIYFTTQDAGLRFKDRQSTKIVVARRNQLLWNFCDLLKATGRVN